MKIYFCGSIAGGRGFLETYKEIVSHLKAARHNVLTEHIVYENVLEFERQFTAEDIYSRDIKMLTECDCVIAEISNPSLGVGYEICFAENLKKPTLCLWMKGIFVSRMITGNPASTLECNEYSDKKEMLNLVDDFLKKL
ncbi:nucleoside 2-deoxyribosyltransferase [candidate division KSB1 bacterium]|nr:nucleoside 2-deoxyribosyltransferase [candidate division KSB1 bacterium]